MAEVTIHANKAVAWHKRYAEYFRRGFARQGIFPQVVSTARRESPVAVLFGPNYWKAIERDGGDYIMVNRVLISTRAGDVNDVVALSWNGFNGRGTFCVDDPNDDRLNLFINPAKDVRPWRKAGEYMLLCGQADLGRCGRYATPGEWYDYVKGTVAEPVIYRPHPNLGARVPLKTHLRMARAAAVLNSTVAVDCLLGGVPVISFDEGNPVHAVAGHTLAETVMGDRMSLFRYLAHCQYFYGEIESGWFWERLNPMRGPRLAEFNAPAHICDD
jgi:hypothetical protein